MFTSSPPFFIFFFFNDTATTEIYTLSLHDALPISAEYLHLPEPHRWGAEHHQRPRARVEACAPAHGSSRSEEHTSELQSQSNLVCRLLLEKKKKKLLIVPPHPLLMMTTSQMILHFC